MPNATSPNKNPTVVIIGAGVAGLTAALHLAELGLNPIILEADEQFVGGRLAGGEQVEFNGFTFRAEHAVHGIWNSYVNLQTMLARLEIQPNFVESTEEAWIYKQGSKVKRSNVGSALHRGIFPPPLHYLNLLLRPDFLRMLDLRDWASLLVVWLGLMWGMGVDPMGEGQPLEGLYLDELVRYWPPKARAFFVGLARNGLSASPEEIPLSGFIAFLRFYSLLRRDAWKFTYMNSDGGTSFGEPLANRAKLLGAQLMMGTRVSKITKGGGDTWRVHYQQDGKAAALDADKVVLALDVNNCKTLVESSPDLEGHDSLYWPRGVETAIIRVWFDRVPNPVADSGILTGDFVLHNFFWLHKLYDDYGEWHQQTGGSAVECHIYNPAELDTHSDEELLILAVRDLQNAFPELRGARIHQTIQRNEIGHTIIEVGPTDRHLAVRSPWLGIAVCGDWVYDRAPSLFIERACLTGIIAANTLLEEQGLKTFKLLPYPPPEPLAALIQNLMQRGRKRRRAKRDKKST